MLRDEINQCRPFCVYSVKALLFQVVFISTCTLAWNRYNNFFNPFTAATRNCHSIKLQLIVHHQINSNRLLKMHFYWNYMYMQCPSFRTLRFRNNGGICELVQRNNALLVY